MTTACPCFGRNENCPMCDGSGIITSEFESHALHAQLRKAERLPQLKNATDPPNREHDTRASWELMQAYRAERTPSIEELRANAAKASAVEYADQLAREGNFKFMPGADLETVNLRRREMKAKLEANLLLVLRSKRAGLVRAGPYRCNRCKWISEVMSEPCALCDSNDGYTEAV